MSLCLQSFDHRREMRVIDDVLPNQSKHRVNKAHKSPGLIERANGRRFACFRDHVEPDGHDADVVVFPDGALKLYALLKVINRYAFSDYNLCV